ncbi:hypothetical protein PVAP13_5NG188881 [Panicum virgatum]|uniref:Uncharacterized protein n=1 Tax=Panicum virgatum TaxID=38727 RepID=A0A8T0RTT5_PANVG|nr:hypothetical protein PVAP13_5NG188881 [Panicum virgatum]
MWFHSSGWGRRACHGRRGATASAHGRGAEKTRQEREDSGKREEPIDEWNPPSQHLSTPTILSTFSLSLSPLRALGASPTPASQHASVATSSVPPCAAASARRQHPQPGGRSLRCRPRMPAAPMARPAGPCTAAHVDRGEMKRGRARKSVALVASLLQRLISPPV